MTPPPIRYPLPTLVLLAALALIGWRGKAWFTAMAAPIRAGITRSLAGPPVPSSSAPMRRAGPIVRKVLVLRDGVEATDLPDGEPVETISRRVFADVYDLWPLKGEPTHYRIGNRRPIGWVVAEAVLAWDTRLVLRPTDGLLTIRDDPSAAEGEAVSVGSSSLPVIDWDEDAVRIVLWETNDAWSRVGRLGWVRIDEVGADEVGVLMSRSELFEAMRLSMEGGNPSVVPERILAVLGRLGEGGGWTREEVGEALDALPTQLMLIRGGPAERSADRLERINEEWNPETSWSGIEYQRIPMDALPMIGERRE